MNLVEMIQANVLYRVYRALVAQAAVRAATHAATRAASTQCTKALAYHHCRLPAEAMATIVVPTVYNVRVHRAHARIWRRCSQLMACRLLQHLHRCAQLTLRTLLRSPVLYLTYLRSSPINWYSCFHFTVQFGTSNSAKFKFPFSPHAQQKKYKKALSRSAGK